MQDSTHLYRKFIWTTQWNDILITFYCIHIKLTFAREDHSLVCVLIKEADRIEKFTSGFHSAKVSLHVKWIFHIFHPFHPILLVSHVNEMENKNLKNSHSNSNCRIRLTMKALRYQNTMYDENENDGQHS